MRPPLPTFGWLAAVAIASAGCDSVCGGKAWCVDQHPATRLALHSGGRWSPERSVWVEADGLVDGTLDEGAEWSVDAWRGNLVVGMPEAEQVVRIAVPHGEVSVDADETWTGRGGEFGHAVATQRARVDRPPELWVSAPGQDVDRGAVYVFRSDAGRDARQADVVLTGASIGDRFGDVLVRCGDVTGDGETDWLVGVPRLSATDDSALESVPDRAGGVFLLSAQDLLDQSGRVRAVDVATVWWGDEAGAAAGTSASCDGDVDGDGVADVVVGAPWHGDEDAGVVYVLHGGELPASGALGDVAWRVEPGDYANGWFGAAVAVGDFDGDGIDELAASSPGYLEGLGRVLVFTGPILKEVPLTAATTLTGPSDRPSLPHVGRRLVRGDVDGDGTDDLLVGSPDWAIDGAHDVGRVSVWLGDVDGWGAALEVGLHEDRAIVGGVAFQRVGGTLLARDLDEDGDDDVLLVTRSREL